MKIKSRKGVELALNMVILVALALVVLVVVIALVTKGGKAMGDQIPKIMGVMDALWQPTSDNPVVLSPSEITMRAGKNNALTLQVYNYAQNEVMCNLGFNSIGQDAIKFTYASTNTNIPAGMVGEWKINVNAPKTTAPDIYMYRLDINCGEFSIQKDTIITVN